MEFLVVSVAAFIFALVLLCLSDSLKRQRIKNRYIKQLKNEDVYLDQELEKSLYQRFIDPVLNKVRKRFDRISRRSRKEETGRYTGLNKELQMAGIGMSAGAFISARLAVSLASLTAALLIVLLTGSSGFLTLMLLLFFLILSILIPRMYLRSRIKSRRQTISNQLPNIMDMMSVNIEAGLGFDAAMLTVTEHFKGPLPDELLRVHREIQMGIPRREALTALSARTDVDELKTFASAVIQSERYGTPVINVLRTQAQELRILRRQRAEETAHKAPVKMLLPMVMFIFPVIFIILLGPAVLEIAAMFAGME
jgi:tight adherence protein C